ncbi:MAG: tetratricopeptide repeat protein [Succinivibrionaceae bacterium]
MKTYKKYLLNLLFFSCFFTANVFAEQPNVNQNKKVQNIKKQEVKVVKNKKSAPKEPLVLKTKVRTKSNVAHDRKLKLCLLEAKTLKYKKISIEACENLKKKGSYLATYILGMRYLNNNSGLDQNIDKAKSYIEEAAQHDIAPALYQLSSFYYNGLYGYPIDLGKAYELAKKANDLGDITEAKIIMINVMLLDDVIQKNNDELFKLASQAVEKDYTEAYVILANFYRYGIGTESNNQEAFRLMSIAEERNSIDATYYMSDYYREGIGVDVDLEKSLEKLVKAADAGHHIARILLGMDYLIEHQLTKGDEELGIKYLKLAADKEDSEACYTLGTYLLKHKKGDPLEAISYIKKAADIGHPYAQNTIGILYLSGTHVEKNSDIGVKYLQQASEQGVKEATDVLRKLNILR